MSKEKKREFDPIKASIPNKDKIRCRDCKYRERAVVEIEGKKVDFGSTKSSCLMFKYIKPLDVLFNNADCPVYRKEAKA